MSLSIDPNAATPPYEQLREQLLAQIASGELSAGAKLPTVRGLAEQLDLAPNTVAKTYRALEQLGAVETRGRRGTVVRSVLPQADLAATIAAREFAFRMHDLGLSTAAALALAETALVEPR